MGLVGSLVAHGPESNRSRLKAAPDQAPGRYDAPMHLIGTGIDLVDVKRIEHMIDEHGQRFLDRCFTSAEQAYADSGTRSRAERYAARFAAKEAVLKVLGTGWRDGIAWTDIEVVREPSGKPVLSVTGRCAELASELGIRQWHVSLSHTASQAFATAQATGDSPSA